MQTLPDCSLQACNLLLLLQAEFRIASSQPGHGHDPFGANSSLQQGGDGSVRIYSVYPYRDLSGDPRLVVAASTVQSMFVSLCRPVVS